MALHLTKPKQKFLTNPSLIHLFSTSSSSPPPQNETESTEQSQSQSQSPDSNSKIPFYINNIRSSLKQNPQSDLQSVKKNLNEFRRRTTDSSSYPARGFTDFYNDGSRKSEIYGNIKANLRQMRSSLSSSSSSSSSRQGRNIERTWMSSFQSDRSRPSESFVKSNVIELGLRTSESKEKKEEMKNELFRRYNDEELGEKLRMFRPEGVKEEGWFTLKELNERLVKLREVEEEEVARRTKEGDGLKFEGLRDGLQRAKDEEAKKNRPFPSVDIWGVLKGRPTHLSEPPKEQLVEIYFHPDNMSAAEKMKIKLAEVREEFKMSESDCGSARVQVAQLTTKIKHLSSVLHKKDKHSRKGLLAMVQRRKKLLKYMRRTDWDSYCISLSKLGLRDNPDYKFVS